MIKKTTMKGVFLLTFLALSVYLTPAQSQQCPPGVPPVNCFADPCTTASCPNIHTATCRADYCGECSARWYIGNIEVTQNCSSALPQCPPSDRPVLAVCNQVCASDSACPQGQTCCRTSSCATACVTPDPCAMIACDVPVCPGGVAPISDNSSCCPYCPSPCATVSCVLPICVNGTQPTVPEGECCPQCPVTNNGTENASCPVPQSGVSGICVFACSDDSSCPGSQLCCSNGCGMVCTDPVRATCTGPDGRVYRPGQTFMAADGCNNCSCTSTGVAICTLRACPQVCVDSSGNRHAVGHNFTAADGCNTCVCNSDRRISCTEIYCPPRNCPTNLPDNCVSSQLICADCSDGNICCSGCCVPPAPITCMDSNGIEHQVNETFTAADGCNTCTCTSTGLAACTRRACPDTCSLPPETGLCDAYFPSYYFNPRTGLCETFVYGGCGGNNNRFSTAGECYRRCNASSQCIQPTYPLGSQINCLVVQRKWAFNATSGLCKAIAFSPCGQESEGYNVFDTESECNRSCIRAEEVCPNGVPIVRCFADPCSVNSCPNFPTARCEANYCGGCNAFFFNETGHNVTDQCSTRALPTPLLANECPMISNSTLGLCYQLCTTNNDCTDDDQICCSNGCGRSCVDPERIPYYDIPRQCPDSGDGDLTTGRCTVTNSTCLMSDECSNSELCCQSGCGRQCLRSVIPSQPCFAVADQFVVTGRLPSGRYVPACDRDTGLFVPVQCHPSTGFCWCVNTRTGQPISSYYARGIRPNCTTCSYNGVSYNAGDTFPSSDGCNTCQCSSTGLVLCTLRACIDTCSLAPDTGPCRGYFPAYYYNRSRGACLPFVYGGCQGNNNKFNTIGDCLGQCNRTSPCLQSRTICIDTFNSSVDSGIYVFNATTGRCERFPSGCTSLPIFSNLMQCQSTCNPGSIPDPCATVRCAQPNCMRDRWVTDPGACCPHCRPADAVQCSDDEFRCSNTSCISRDWVCDGLRDCDDGRDEADAICLRNRTCTGHVCGNGDCISSDYVCDNFLDCRDASDEANCTSTNFVNTYYPTELPTRCPNSTSLIGSCVQECSSDNPCDRDRELCCSNGCGFTCMRGETVAPLCPALARQQYGAIGAFVPQCERDGSFSTTQCWGSTGYCWCVDTTTGRAISEGIRGAPRCSGCAVDDVVYPYGERFTADDGCNTCYCTSTGLAVCTREACAPVSCTVLDREIPHGESLVDACSNCTCRSGQLNCTRKVCATTGAITQKQPTRVSMGYEGDLDQVSPTDEHKQNFKREIMKTLLNRYKSSLGLTQEQITSIELSKDDGIKIDITLMESQNATSGANVSLLIGQMQQDYQSSALVIRYNQAVLEPSGNFQVDDNEVASGSSAFPWWGILIVVLGALAIAAVIAVVVMGIIVKSKSGRQYTAEDNDYTNVAYNKQEDNDEVKLALDDN